ncbi:MAG: hypothetical protein CBD18_07960 [Opitutales bacterium TMED158]|nr:MAG: hypothetical protein CBD18_07960 [Opitutales bacterium TMED158]
MPRRHGIAWLTTLSLDAPIVAIAWQHAIAHEFELGIQWHHRVLVFASVWLGYSADRWLDAWRHTANISFRHRFHGEHRWRLLAFWILLLALSIAIATQLLTDAELASGLFLVAASIIATAIIQGIRLKAFQSLMKSMLTAILLTGSILLFARPPHQSDLLATVLLLGSLFSTNCCLIHFWDRPVDAIQEPNPATSRRLKSLTAMATLCLGFQASFYTFPIVPCVFASFGLLAALFGLQDRISIETRRVLADLSLIIPLFPLFSI